MADTPRPTALPVDLNQIPATLMAECRWVGWRYEARGHTGRWSKIPYSAITGHRASANDPATWTTFDHVVTMYRAGDLDGLGFCLGDGWAGVDLDHCRDIGNPETHLAARLYLAELDCYVEVSPSGHGYKAIGRAPRIGGEINFTTTPVGLTVWQGPRYFAITGHGSGSPQRDLSRFLDKFVPVRSTAPDALGPMPAFLTLGDTRGTELIERFTDDQVVERILASPSAEKFSRLVRGDMSAYGHDHSCADQALLSLLAYWCQGDLDQVDRLFRKSGLMREHWNTPSYRRASLKKAVSRWTS
jgi:putative DNA primase/helicase